MMLSVWVISNFTSIYFIISFEFKIAQFYSVPFV